MEKQALLTPSECLAVLVRLKLENPALSHHSASGGRSPGETLLIALRQPDASSKSNFIRDNEYPAYSPKAS